MQRPGVKASSIANLTDARYFSAFEVDYLGFCFDPLSKNYLSPETALEIKNWLSGPNIVGEFAHQDWDNIWSIGELLGLDAFELDWTSFAQLDAGHGKQIHLRLNESEIDQYLKSTHRADLLILQSGSLENEDRLNAIRELHPVYAEGNWTETELQALIKAEQADGFCLNGGAEEQVGLKAFDILDPLMELLRTEI